ncbi:Cell division protein FtsQ [BD1-7 clade bacterium]|uniref:Cell division protein FtsQ n=1 Tax=BD1-7 clade bacterium TaxID=2029982 RepID=A0A5S9N2D9_9GAMM|nr:Cell division protein FtsQ [BD1-7 clade bacterium]
MNKPGSNKRTTGKNKRNTQRRGVVVAQERRRVIDTLKAVAPLVLNKTLLTAAIAIAAASAYVSMRAVEEVLDVPLEQVAITGDIQYLPRQNVQAIIEKTARDGFVEVDLKHLYASLKGLEWVRDVSIKRTLPNGLRIELLEQQPIAYWNDDALITSFAEVITPARVPDITGLVRMSGNDHQEVLAVYKKTKALLPEEYSRIRALMIDDRKVVSIVLADGYELVVNKGQLEQQLGRWQDILASSLSDKLNQVETVDLRYSNGAAVSWKATLAQSHKLLNGGHH